VHPGALTRPPCREFPAESFNELDMWTRTRGQRTASLSVAFSGISMIVAIYKRSARPTQKCLYSPLPDECTAGTYSAGGVRSGLIHVYLAHCLPKFCRRDSSGAFIVNTHQLPLLQAVDSVNNQSIKAVLPRFIITFAHTVVAGIPLNALIKKCMTQPLAAASSERLMQRQSRDVRCCAKRRYSTKSNFGIEVLRQIQV
jgi:hypothetical protein